MRYRIALLIVTGAILAFGSIGLLFAQAGGSWASFRSNATLSGVAGSTLPEKPRLLWTRDLDGGITSTAAVVGNTAYVGTDEGKLEALNMANGKPLWTFDAKETISASPCVIGDAVYFGDENGDFYAVNAVTGKKAWHFAAEDKIISSATPAPGVVLVGSYDNKLYCLDDGNGKLKWAFEADAQVHSTPCIAENQAMIAGCDGLVRMINVDTGKQNATATIGDNFASSPAYYGGIVYVGSLKGSYVAVQMKDGKVLWTMEEEDGNGSCESCAAVTKDAVIFSSKNNKVFRLERATGKVQWFYQTKDAVESSPVIAGDTVYFGCNDGKIYGVTLGGGKLTWSFDTGASVKASAAIANGKLVIGDTDGAVYCFGK